MLIKGIDFPQELLQAQAAGELVVFAGAGVSNPPPSSLPLFAGLAAMIGQASGLEKDANDPEDRYLGRLKQRDVRVHEAAARILVNQHTKPHDLHRYLMRLFSSPGKVRIVTTNFDTHFTTSAKETFEDGVTIFTAPALPLGDDFSGLVYLHGSAGSDPMRCVLTDEDFGRAYLTQAWASRFLAAMFSRYVVMFVGYSHEDTVMNYLARGLPPVSQKPRFALVPDTGGPFSKWEFLGIRPIAYKLCDGANKHKALTDSIGEWVKELQRGLFEKAQRIRAVAEAQPPLEGEDADYIKYSLSDPDTTRIFFKHATSPEWISWLEKNEFIQPVFDPQKKLGPFHCELALWLADAFVVQKPQELMASIERHNSTLNPHLCWCIWRRLFKRDHTSLPTQIFSQWVAILLAQPIASLPSHNWNTLLNECRFPDDKLISIHTRHTGSWN